MARVFVEEGQHVGKGQLLAELEPTDYRNASTPPVPRSKRRKPWRKRRTPDCGNRKWKRLASTSIAGKTSTSACGSSWNERACPRTTFRRSRRLTTLRGSDIRWPLRGRGLEDRNCRHGTGAGRKGAGQRGIEAAGRYPAGGADNRQHIDAPGGSRLRRLPPGAPVFPSSTSTRRKCA